MKFLGLPWLFCDVHGHSVCLTKILCCHWPVCSVMWSHAGSCGSLSGPCSLEFCRVSDGSISVVFGSPCVVGWYCTALW